ncbi:DNA primase [Saccharibacillus sp. CPCC 101409]|uniref:DNA primase n=1 Tax=Saccharibacillus sp. CPCC 101409 TaxID=3058041 RepID=UPI002671B890|nr:DNA primase [Saccharibacillus sp. CPCC 101409]MDO3409180.1 DNA primase [Saccharibacillus sp. CPCC 101409]
MSTEYGNIPEETIDAVLQQHDIVETVGRYVHLTKQGKYMKGLCPFHSEKTPSFTVTPDRQIFYCYGCGTGGNAIKFRMEIEGLSFPEAVKIMAEESHIPVQNSGGKPESPQDRETGRLLQAYEWSEKFYHFLLKNTEHGRPALEYLRGRGIGDKLIDQFGIGFAPDRWDTLVQFLDKRQFDLAEMEKGGLISAKQSGDGYVDRFRGRIMFPIANRSGKTIAFAGRVLGEGQPKYMNSPESRLFNKSRVLYNFGQARSAVRKQRQAILFEGYGDVIAAWEAGVHNGIATMGTSLTEQHAAMIKTTADEVIVCYDGDNAGQNAALKSIPILEQAGLQVKIAMLPQGVDPDDYIRSNGGDRFTNQVVGDAVSTTKFRLSNLRRGYKLTEESGRVDYAKAALPVIAALNSPTEREVYLRELSSEVDVSFDSLKQDCNLLRQEQSRRAPGPNDPGPEYGAPPGGGQSGRPDKYGGGKYGKSRNFGREGQGRRYGNDRKADAGEDVRYEQRIRPDRNLLPAYQTAERRLLFLMLQDRQAADYVSQRLGDEFNMPEHAAIAAYLYAFYAQDREPDSSRFISSLQDEKLEKTVSSIAMMEGPREWNEQVLDDCIREVRKVPRMQGIERKREEMMRAEKSGDFLLAAQIASEIIALERQ